MPDDGASLSAEGARESGATRSNTAGPGGDYSHVPPQLRPPPADERHPDQLLVALAGALVDSDDADLPGTCAGSDGKCREHPVELSGGLSTWR